MLLLVARTSGDARLDKAIMRIAAPRTAHIVYARVASGVRWWLRTKFRRKGAESGGVPGEASGLLGKIYTETRLMGRV
jgi:hypothetical protein